MAALLDNAMDLQLINRIEQVTGADIDGDGDIGEGESGDLPFVNSAETLTGFDLDGDDSLVGGSHLLCGLDLQDAVVFAVQRRQERRVPGRAVGVRPCAKQGPDLTPRSIK